LADDQLAFEGCLQFAVVGCAWCEHLAAGRIVEPTSGTTQAHAADQR
jgi:hypothetical protein